MYRFGEQIEYRIDRRQMIWLFLGGLCWTLLAFLLGMVAAERGSVRKNLMALGWWETPEQNILAVSPQVKRESRGSVAFSFKPGVAQKLKKLAGDEHKVGAVSTRVPTTVGHLATAKQKRSRSEDRASSQDRKEDKGAKRGVESSKSGGNPRGGRLESPVVGRDSTENSILAEARAFRLRAGGDAKLPTQGSNYCRALVSESVTSYYGVVVKTSSDLVSMRRWRKLLKQAGYWVRIKNLRGGRRGRLVVVVGRFATKQQGRECLQHLVKAKSLSGAVMLFRP